MTLEPKKRIECGEIPPFSWRDGLYRAGKTAKRAARAGKESGKGKEAVCLTFPIVPTLEHNNVSI